MKISERNTATLERAKIIYEKQLQVAQKKLDTSTDILIFRMMRQKAITDIESFLYRITTELSLRK